MTTCAATLEKPKLAYEFPWSGQPLQWSVERPIAFDTETEVVPDLLKEVPRLALATASDGERHVVLRPDQVAQFLIVHQDAHFVFHNFSFDCWVVDRYLGDLRDHPDRVFTDVWTLAALEVWWKAVDEGRVHDTLYLDMLIRIAKGEGEQGGWDDNIYNRNLAMVAKAYCEDADVNKKDPYRMRYGELLDLDDWSYVDPGFLEYAAGDAYWTWRAYQAMLPVAQELSLFAKDEAYPNATERYGLLTEKVQVWAAVALAAVSRFGIRLDIDHARRYEATLRAEYEDCLAWLDAQHPTLFQKYTPAYATRMQLPAPYKYTKVTLTPKLNTTTLRAILSVVAGDLGIPVPKSTGKLGLDSISTRPWSDYIADHEFLRRWSRLDKLKNLVKFLSAFHTGHDQLFVRYDVLKRTGRTSATKAKKGERGLAIQQAPKDKEFRSLFIPLEGHKYLIIDYSAIELRTLATICLKRYGKSALADVILSGKDPHCHVASYFLKEDYATIATAVEREKAAVKLARKEGRPAPPTPYTEVRQKVKAVSFGVPGGLGAPKLVAYAKANYGVVLTEEEAETFRRGIMTEVYPEWNNTTGYLSSTALVDLAHNTKQSKTQVYAAIKQFTAWSRNPMPASMVLMCLEKIIKGNPNKPDGTPYKEFFVESLWNWVTDLAADAPEHVRDLLARRAAGPVLYRELFASKAITLTGRIRGGVGYTQVKNGPFQGLAADGAKIAFYRSIRAGLRVVMFVHDELVYELPEDQVDVLAPKAIAIVEDSMAEVLDYQVPVASEWSIADCWGKG